MDNILMKKKIFGEVSSTAPNVTMSRSLGTV
jgi:hypothetical protein